MSTDYLRAVRDARTATPEPRESLVEVRDQRDAFLGLLAAERANGVALTRYGRDITELRSVERRECEDAAAAALWAWVTGTDEQVAVARSIAARQEQWGQR